MQERKKSSLTLEEELLYFVAFIIVMLKKVVFRRKLLILSSTRLKSMTARFTRFDTAKPVPKLCIPVLLPLEYMTKFPLLKMLVCLFILFLEDLYFILLTARVCSWVNQVCKEKRHSIILRVWPYFDERVDDKILFDSEGFLTCNFMVKLSASRNPLKEDPILLSPSALTVSSTGIRHGCSGYQGVPFGGGARTLRMHYTFTLLEDK